MDRKMAKMNPGRDTSGADLINHLPDECMLHIFSFLLASCDRLSCAAVSKKWLLLQAHMRCSEFKIVRNNDDEDSPASRLPEDLAVSRCLERGDANDMRLAAAVVGIAPPKVLTELELKVLSPTALPRCHHTAVTNFGLKIVGLACPNLKSLKLWYCPHIGDQGLACVAQGCSALESLRLFHTSLVGDDGLIAIAKGCLNLSTLSLEACPRISVRSMEAIAKHSSNIRSISLVRCPNLDHAGIVSIISQLPKLARIKLGITKLGDNVLQAIGEQARSLQSLFLERISGTTERGYAWIGAAEKLEILTLISCFGLADSSFTTTAANSFPRLKKMVIKNCDSLTDDGLIALTKRTKLLDSLKLEKCNKITSRGIVGVLSNCHKTLKVLSLDSCDLVGEQEEEEEVAPPPPEVFPSLTLLKLKKCDRIRDSFLMLLGAACKQVKRLGLMGMASITDRGLLTLLKLLEVPTEIAMLDLSGCAAISDWSVLAIMQTCGPKLRTLRLPRCTGLSDWSLGLVGELCPRLVELDLAGCEVSDFGVQRIVSARGLTLRDLSLARCTRISDESLRALVSVRWNSSLRHLNLLHCPGLTQQGIDSIKEDIWWCDITY